MLGNVKQEKIRFRDINFRLLIYVSLLSIVGIFVVQSATVNQTSGSLISPTLKQLIGVLGGLVLLGLFTLLDYQKLTRYSWIFYILALLALLYVQFFAPAISGAKRWIHVPLLGTIQPSEFGKPALILALAFVTELLEDKKHKFYGILLVLLVASPILLLVLKEPDLSTTIVLTLIVISILFVAEIPYRYVVGFLIALIPLVVFFLIAVYQDGQPILNSIFEEHQVQRINAYFFPDDYPAIVYQQKNSVLAIGSGGFFGKGLNTSSLESVKNGNFLSEEQCDFILAVIGEELGFLGTMVLLILEGLIVFECFRTAYHCTDLSGRLIAVGAGASLGFQSLINIGVATLLIPNTGIPLPFLSAGLSSLLSSFILVGMVINVGLRGNKKRRVYYQ